MNVTKVQWVAILSISGLYIHTKIIFRIMMSMSRLRQKRDMLHRSVCCKDTQPSANQWRCQWLCLQSMLGLINLIFVDAGVKINGAYYPDMFAVFFTFQQCNAPAALRAWETINLLERQIPVLLSFHHICDTQQHRSEPAWLEKMRRNAEAGLPSLWRRWTEAVYDWCLACFLSKNEWHMHVISGSNISVWVFVWKCEILSI